MADKRSLTELIKQSDLRLSEAFPKELTGDNVFTMLDQYLKGLAAYQGGVNVLLPFIGKLLMIVEDNPQFYRGMEYDTYKAWLKAEIQDKYRVGRSTCYRARQVALQWPDLTVEMYRDIGIEKLLLAAKCCNTSTPNATKVLEKARSMSLQEFKAWMVQRGYATAGELSPSTIVIKTTVERASIWKKFWNDPVNQAKCGSSQQDVIFERCIEECSSWASDVQEALNVKAAG